MTQSSNAPMEHLVEQLRQIPGLADRLPAQEGEIVRDALAGRSIYDIAQQHRVSERAVWDLLQNAVRSARGESVAQVETGGLGSDTDPGVTGGYGDTGFGSIGNEPPTPVPEEPPDRLAQRQPPREESDSS